MPPVDPRNIITGSSGELYALDGDYLGDVPEFEARYTVTNMRHRPMGEMRGLAILDTYEVMLTFTQTVITDELLKRIRDALANRQQPVFDFQGLLRRPSDGQLHRSVFYKCVPDGDISILSYRPGEIVSRPWSFFVNGDHDLPAVLGT
jgi:hypothetical protein